MLPDLKKDFSRFLSAAPERLHFAAHSHHYWPDVTFDAHVQLWQDAAQWADAKWPFIFETVIPDVKSGIASILNLPDASSICFAPNTHEFLVRLLSCLPTDRPLKILTSDSEFYSFDRQIKRLEEDGIVTVRRVPSKPLETFTTRFAAAASHHDDHDMVFVSQVFFNSGFIVTPLTEIVRAVKNAQALIVIDGYHGFMAAPTDLSAIADRVFYLGGGYKYAMSGEGACFMHCPSGYGARPRNTGWFAEFGTLHGNKSGGIDYGADASRFAGATADPAGLYRMRAVFGWMQAQGITIDALHQHAHHLQNVFVTALDARQIPQLSSAQLAVPLSDVRRGNFLTFVTQDAAVMCETLKKFHVVTDHRGDCLRFGFGPYHDVSDVIKLVEIIQRHVR